jgi:hypothetical protein
LKSDVSQSNAKPLLAEPNGHVNDAAFESENSAAGDAPHFGRARSIEAQSHLLLVNRSKFEWAVRRKVPVSTAKDCSFLPTES